MAHKLTEKRRADNYAAQQRHLDRIAAIDVKLDAARAAIDWERRTRAESSLVEWVKTYCVGILLDDPPPQKGEQILSEMERAITDTRPYQIQMGRGQGKTSYVECAVVFGIATGKRTFPVIVSANARAASNILTDIFRIYQEPDTAFADDYPDLCLPIQACNGSYRRKQTYRGIDTEISKTASQFCLARLTLEDGTIPTTGPCLATRGITSGIRGLKHHTRRPDLVVVDDPQTAEDSSNPETVAKLLDIIKKDVLNISGKGKLAVLMTSTPIAPDDLTQKIKEDSNWKTTVWPSIISWPRDVTDNGNKGLWAQYFSLYDSENVADKPHVESLEFYKRNRAAMDDGAEVFNPARFLESDGHVSALQALLEKRHLIGASAFDAEYQMQVKRYQASIDITPKIVLSRIAETPRLVVPDGFVFVCAATDLNVGTIGATTTITAFRPDMTARVIYRHITHSRISATLNETAYNQGVYNLLATVGKELAATGVHLDGWAVDCGGRNWDAVLLFAKNSMQICGIPCCGFAGRAANVWPKVAFGRSRLRDAIGRTVLCGDPNEHQKTGSGQKWVYFDADGMKESAQKALMSELGAPGGLSLYHAPENEWAAFAIQICNERLLFVRRDATGTSFYSWRSVDPHDFLDCLSMSYACAQSQGISGRIDSGLAGLRKIQANPYHKLLRPRRKPRIKIV